MAIVVKFLDWVGRLQVIQGLGQWAWALWPAGTAILTGGVGLLSGQSLMWVMVAVSAVAACGSVAIFFFSLQRERNNPLNKLKIGNVIFPYELAPPIEHNRQVRQGMAKAKVVVPAPPRRLTKAQLGMEIINTAPYPISIIVWAADTEIANKKPPRVKYPKEPLILQQGGLIWVHDEPIDLKGEVCAPIKGSIEIVIKYGYAGKENLFLTHKGTVEIFMESSGMLKTIYFHPSSLLGS